MAYTLTNLINAVLPDVIGCPQPLIESTVRDVLSEFCGTGILNKGFKKDVLSTDPASPNDHIDITTPTTMALYSPVDILWMYIDGYPYEAKRREISDDLDEMDMIEENNVKFWYPSSGTNIVVYPFSDAAACQIYLQMSFKPGPAGTFLLASTLDDQFYERWHEAIVSGVKARLLVMPKKAWSGDKGIVSWYQSIYDKGVSAATISMMNRMDKTVSRAKNQFI